MSHSFIIRPEDFVTEVRHKDVGCASVSGLPKFDAVLTHVPSTTVVVSPSKGDPSDAVTAAWCEMLPLLHRFGWRRQCDTETQRSSLDFLVRMAMAKEMPAIYERLVEASGRAAEQYIQDEVNIRVAAALAKDAS